MNTPYIETERLILRPFCEEDTQNVFDCWESDPEVAKYMFWCSHNNINKTKEWITYEMEQIPSDTWYRWVFNYKENNLLRSSLNNLTR